MSLSTANGRAFQEIQQAETAACTCIANGNYWYDANSGYWGYVRRAGNGSRLFVIADPAGTTVVSTWWRGPNDTGV